MGDSMLCYICLAGLWGIMNNAGIGGAVAPADWLSLNDYRECMAINLYGVVDVATTFLSLVKQERGRVVNTASMMGRFALPGATPYCISKYGVEAFSDILR